MKRFIGVIVGIGLIVLGILFMTVISKNAADLQKRCTAETTGKVIDTVEKYDTDEGGTTYDTTISYEVDGKSYEEYFNIPDRKDNGYEYNVKYNPDNPEECFVEGVSATSGFLRIFGIITMVIGVIVMICSGIAALRR